MSSSRRPRGIARNAIANWSAFLYVAGVSFFLSPYIVEHLGATAYGVWSLLVALVGYLGLLDFGVRGAVTRYIAQYHAVDDTRSASSIAAAALTLFGGLGLLALVLSVLMAWLSPHLFNIPPALASEAQVVLAVGGLTVAMTLVGAVFGGIVTGLERFDISSGIEIFVTTLRTACVIAALATGHGLVALAWIHLGAAILYGLFAYIAARRTYPELRFDFSQPLKPHIRTILGFSAFLSIIHVLGVVIYYTDALVIAVVLPMSAVAIFAIAGNLADYAAKVASSLSKMMTPRVSALTSSGSGSVSEAVLSTARVATLATAPIAATFLFRGESFIGLWMGAQYAQPSGAVLKVLAFLVWVNGARAVAGASIIGANQHRRLIPALAFEAICNLGLSILLAHLVGVVGVALGSLVPGLIVGLLYFPYCLRKSVGVPQGQFYLRAWGLPTLACLPFVAATLLVEHYFPARNLLIFFAQVVACVPLVPLTALFVCATPAERADLRRRFGRLTGRPTPASASVATGTSPRKMTLLRALGILIEERGEILRGSLLLVARGAAFVLPVRGTWAVSRVLGVPAALLDYSARKTWLDFRAAFGIGFFAALRLGIRSHALRFNEAFLMQKLIRGRFDYFRRPVVVEASDDARAILAAPGSYVLATAHFSRGVAAASLFCDEHFGRHMCLVAARLPRWPWTPHLWRMRLQLEQALAAVRAFRPQKLEFVYTGGAFNELVQRLRSESIIATLNADAHWPKGRSSSFSRPFAGSHCRTFSTGPARIARLSGCPLMLALPQFDPERLETRLRVLGPFRSSSSDPEQSDREVTSQLLDAIEHEVGMRPAFYALEIGGERRWDARTETWSDLPPAVESGAVALESK